MKKNKVKKLSFKKNTVSNLEKTDMVKIKGATGSACGGFTGMGTDYTCQAGC
jgi:hypothetical protein